MKKTKYILALMAILFCASCATVFLPPEYRGEGVRDSEGRPDGAWTLYHSANNSVMGKGSFSNGSPAGKWTFYDSAGTRIAELNFKDDSLNGSYNLYYGSFGYSKSKGRIKTIGSADNGVLKGRFRRFEPDGNLIVDYTTNEGRDLIVNVGTEREAIFQLKADYEYLDVIFKSFAIATEDNQSK